MNNIAARRKEAAERGLCINCFEAIATHVHGVDETKAYFCSPRCAKEFERNGTNMTRDNDFTRRQ